MQDCLIQESWSSSLPHERQCRAWIEYEPQHKTSPKSLAVRPGIRISELSFFSLRGHGLSESVGQRKGEIGAEGWLRLGWLVWSLNQPWGSLKGHRVDSPRCTLTGRAECTLEESWWQLIYGFTFARPVL